MLTDEEQKALKLSAELWNLVARIVGQGPTRSSDLDDFAFHFHGIQNAILANAAARQYPDKYRLLGQTLER